MNYYDALTKVKDVKDIDSVSSDEIVAALTTESHYNGHTHQTGDAVKADTGRPEEDTQQASEEIESSRDGSNAGHEEADEEADGEAAAREEAGSSKEETAQGSTGRFKIKNPIVWIDLEMTGLNPDKDHILELALLITDGELSGKHLEGPELVIHQSDAVLNDMNEWSARVHGKTGLTKKCRQSKICLKHAEDQVLEFLQEHTAALQDVGDSMHKAHLAGNSIYMDRSFLRKHMPRVDSHLHWRQIDCSTLLELGRRWFPEEMKRAPKKRVAHTAMADIKESLAELRFYRSTIFKQPGVSYKEYLQATRAANESSLQPSPRMEAKKPQSPHGSAKKTGKKGRR